MTGFLISSQAPRLAWIRPHAWRGSGPTPGVDPGWYLQARRHQPGERIIEVSRARPGSQVAYWPIMSSSPLLHAKPATWPESAAAA